MHKTVQLTGIQDATTWQRAPNREREMGWMGVTLTRLDLPCLALCCVTLQRKRKKKEGKEAKKTNKMKQNKSFPES